MATIRVGVSGWSYDEWRGGFYPAGLARRDELAHLARTFDTVELNTTFYGLVRPEEVRRWHDATPSSFRFAVKGSRYITHTKRLRDVEVALANFWASGILALGPKLGPVLWQLPADLHFDRRRLDGFLALLPHSTDAAARAATGHDGRVTEPWWAVARNHRLRHALEVRHESYRTPGLVTVLGRHGVALVVSDAPDWPRFEEITAGFVYVRLHGHERRYAGSYGQAGLEALAGRVRTWHAGGQPTDAVRITDRRPPSRRGRDVYVYFDNTAAGDAPADARTLTDLVGR